MAPYDIHKSRLAFLERKMLFTWDEKKEVGSLCGHIVEYGWPRYTWYEPLHRFKDGDYWIHAWFGK